MAGEGGEALLQRLLVANIGQDLVEPGEFHRLAGGDK
jgi:hypothetical protein